MGRGQHAVYTCFPPFAQYWNKKPGGGGDGGGGEGRDNHSDGFYCLAIMSLHANSN